MRVIVRAALASIALAMALALPAQASASSWSKSTTHYTIYFDGGYATMPFSPPTSVPNSGTSITNVAFDWNAYNNGNTTEIVELCYQQRFSSTDYRCTDVSSTQTGTTSVFNGLDAKGSFTIKHTIFGGTYFAFGNGIQDTVTVSYLP